MTEFDPNGAHDAIRQVIESGDFSQFLGRAEDAFLEVKGPAPYDLGLPSGRYELAKDVSAFANAEGGYLLIGLEGKKDEGARIDEIHSLQLLPVTDFNAPQYEGLLRIHIVPRIQGLSVTWRASSDNPELGLGVVYVPIQPEAKKLFLVTRLVEEGEEQKATVVAIARRVGGDNVPLTAVEIYEAIRKGRETILQRSIRIEDKLDLLLARGSGAAPPTVDPVAVLQGRINRLKDSK